VLAKSLCCVGEVGETVIEGEDDRSVRERYATRQSRAQFGDGHRRPTARGDEVDVVGKLLGVTEYGAIHRGGSMETEW
jgi:hypothetical protein